MSVDVDIDVELLKSEIKKTYASVSRSRGRTSSSPPGVPGPKILATRTSPRTCPSRRSNRSPASPTRGNGPAGTGRAGARSRLWRRHRLAVAAQMVGEQGHVTGIDMTQEMLAKARAAAAEMGATNVEFVEGEAERLPFPDASFDVVISNGVIDLVPDKDAVFSELFRVLAPAGACRSRTSRSRTRSAPKGDATSTSGLAELPERCWKQRTPSSWKVTASSGSRPASSWTRTPDPRSRTRVAKPRSSAPGGRPSRPTSRASDVTTRLDWTRP